MTAIKDLRHEDIFKELYGHHETCHSDLQHAEVHLQTQVQCDKNKGHEDFIPVQSFGIEHLPESYRDDASFQFVKALFGFTVKIDVKLTSGDRPEYWVKTTTPYPNYNMRGQRSLRMGTGSIRSVYKYADGVCEDGGSRHWKLLNTCSCNGCQESEAPSGVWWEIEVLTATHIIYDEAEAREAKCTLFYDGPGAQWVILDQVWVNDANVESDKCWLRCVTCDQALVDTLSKMQDEYSDRWKRLASIYMSNRNMEKLAFIVSHPHGCSKQVTLGLWTKRIRLDGGENWSCYLYDTPTCPGTSGATVYILGHHNGQRYTYSDHHVHIGVNKRGANYCGGGVDF